MREKGKFSDAFNSLNGNLDLRIAVLENSNKLKEMGIDSPGQIERLYKSGDFLAFHDPLKIKNLEMFGIDNNSTDQILVAEVMDRTRGNKAYQFVNISDTDKMKKGDILTLDPKQEGKESGTEFQESFEEYCMSIVKEVMPNIDSVASGKQVIKALGLKTYEDVIYLSAKKDGFRQEILNKVKTPGARKDFMSKLNVNENMKENAEENRVISEEETEQDTGMTVEEAAVVLGIEEEKLEQVVGSTGKILGMKTTSDIAGLSKQLGHELEDTTSDVTLIKAVGPGVKSEGFVVDSDGNEIYSSKDGDTKLITELVEDGSNGDNIASIDDAIKEQNVESKKVKTIDPTTGKGVVEFVEQGNEKAVVGYESDANQLLKDLEKKIQIIKDGPGNESEKLAMISDVLYNAKGRLGDLQVAYGIQEQDNLNSLEEQADDYAAGSEVAAAKENIGKVVGAVMPTRALMNVADDDGGHERLTPAEEAMRKRGF